MKSTNYRNASGRSLAVAVALIAGTIGLVSVVHQPVEDTAPRVVVSWEQDSHVCWVEENDLMPNGLETLCR